MAVTPIFCKIVTTTRNKAELQANVDALTNIINELLTTALTSVQEGNIAEYELDTGQSKTRVKYTNTKTVLDSIAGYEKLLIYYEGLLFGGNVGMVRLMDQKNF